MLDQHHALFVLRVERTSEQERRWADEQAARLAYDLSRPGRRWARQARAWCEARRRDRLETRLRKLA